MFQDQLSQQNHNQEPDPELTKQFLAYQQQQLKLEEIRLQYEILRLQQDGKLAEKSMDTNSLFFRNAPAEKRKTVITYGVVASVIFSIFLIFIVYCVNSGKEEFVKMFLTWISHSATIAFGYWIGRSTTKRGKKFPRSKDIIAEAEIVD